MPDFLKEALSNDVLWVSVFASLVAQLMKPFTYWMQGEKFSWSHVSDTGGMPSSHSALVSAVATGVGIDRGFDSALFAIAVAIAAVVTYDAAGVRRQAGEQARVLNQMLTMLLSGDPIAKTQLKEVLGHSRTEVFAGIVFGIALMLLWKLVLFT
nr:divergent PAP2 family protein [Anaerolineae bacterium]